MNGKPSLHYVEVAAQAEDALAAAWLQRLSPARRASVERLREPLDRAATLAGVALLDHALRAAGCTVAPDRVVRPAHGKPRLPDGPEFSIAHAHAAGETALVACVLAVGMRLGVDLEPCGAVRPAQLRLVLDPEETAAVVAGRLDATDAWVMKEAVVKASGRGAAAARTVALRGLTAVHAGAVWHLQRVDVGGRHVAWVATDRELPPGAVRVHPHPVAVLGALPA